MGQADQRGCLQPGKPPPCCHRGPGRPGQDLRLCIWGSQLELAHCYSPAHTRLISGVACSPESPHLVATAAQDGLVKIWDTRSQKPCSTVHRSSTAPSSTLTWVGEKLLVGTRC